jgi:hypothetical protein
MKSKAPVRLAALLLCAVAQTAAAVPLVDSAPRSAPAEDRAADAARSPDASAVAAQLQSRLATDSPHAALFGRDGGGGAPVAEPSTLLLVSFGLFGLIAWSRRRRQ